MVAALKYGKAVMIGSSMNNAAIVLYAIAPDWGLGETNFFTLKLQVTPGPIRPLRFMISGGTWHTFGHQPGTLQLLVAPYSHFLCAHRQYLRSNMRFYLVLLSLCCVVSVALSRTTSYPASPVSDWHAWNEKHDISSALSTDGSVLELKLTGTDAVKDVFVTYNVRTHHERTHSAYAHTHEKGDTGSSK